MLLEPLWVELAGDKSRRAVKRLALFFLRQSDRFVIPSPEIISLLISLSPRE